MMIVGLGNPGKKYEMTRHNMGYLVVQVFAHKYEWMFKEKKQLNAKIAKGKVKDATIHLVLPTTYMNESGMAVRKVMDYYKWDIDDLLVIVDDIALPFGEMRLRKMGSAGGHNGLVSVQKHVGTTRYARLRMGIGRHKETKTLTKHVLEKFTKEEVEGLKSFIEKAVEVLLLLQTESIDNVMNVVNKRI